MDTEKIEKVEKSEGVGYPFRTFNISMKGLKELVGHLLNPVHVLRKDMETIEEINADGLDWTGECVAVMFYNSVVYLETPMWLGIKTSWCEKDKTRIYHDALLEGFDKPIYWEGHVDHPNCRAREIGFLFGSEKNWGCINGKSIDWFRWTDSISGLEISVYEDGEKIIPIEKTGCYKCADGMKIHVDDTKKNVIEDLDNRVHYYENLIAKAKQEIDDYKGYKETLEKQRSDIRSLSPATVWEQHPEFRK